MVIITSGIYQRIAYKLKKLATGSLAAVLLRISVIMSVFVKLFKGQLLAVIHETAINKQNCNNYVM